jgi:hypothetical protein
VKVTFEVWRQPDSSKIHLRLLEDSAKEKDFTVDPRAHYSGGNPRLYKALDALLKDMNQPD